MEFLKVRCISCRKTWTWYKGFDTCPRCGNIRKDALHNGRWKTVKVRGRKIFLVPRKAEIDDAEALLKQKVSF